MWFRKTDVAQIKLAMQQLGGDGLTVTAAAAFIGVTKRTIYLLELPDAAPWLPEGRLVPQERRERGPTVGRTAKAYKQADLQILRDAFDPVTKRFKRHLVAQGDIIPDADSPLPPDTKAYLLEQEMVTEMVPMPVSNQRLDSDIPEILDDVKRHTAYLPEIHERLKHIQAAMEVRTAPKVPPTGVASVQLRGPDERVTVCGVSKDPILPRAFAAVKALLDAYPGSLRKDALSRESRVSDPHKALAALANADEEWRLSLSFPGSGYKAGYRIRALTEALAIPSE
jgi:hypothetical protein